MTAPSLLDELERVVRLSNEADRLPYGEGRAYAYRDATVRALNFVLDYHAELADMANELRVARESFKRCDEICKCTAEGWRTAEEDMAKRLEAAERDAARYRWLRNHRLDFIVRNNSADPRLSLPMGTDLMEPSATDACIDAAIAAWNRRTPEQPT